ncbi:DNA-processing protein DprA [Pseudohoeflea coraliihabitans]|uniref:DNA-processing protein DprA n=1 Tax=Pseudohoeflea coraliihabitans TaxID=2860393 RepID=A0ABS6WSI3_9HYPH|nr:DNA-processing protein DprA [Pseudohoeflea sp. DP4N28-3]MBW3098916.1 DNA-processing protein DprA [Pseudohoeflea sp. DP4N28-3]
MTGTGGPGVRLSERQRLAWLRLIRSDNVGPATFRDLINHFGSAERAIAHLPELSQRGGARRQIRIATPAQAEAELAAAARFGAVFVGIGEPDYPAALRRIDGAPPLIAAIGDLRVAHGPAVGIVGSRNASISGTKFATRLAREIGAAGYRIVSGLARGIDAAAHEASLDTGTIAAMAGGLDRPYPPENLDLYERIREGAGLALSEMPMGWEPRARDFPRRNRLIAGISLGVVVIEAAARSGSLITARRANDFGRLVFAVPGSPLDPRAAGTNGLLKEGAILTTRAADVLDALAPISRIAPDDEPLIEEPDEGATPDWDPPRDDERARVAGALGPSPVEIDDIIRHCGLPAATVHYILLELDLAGRLDRHPGGMVSLGSGET